MKINTLIRWGGLSALLSGVIGIIGDIAHFITVGGLPLSDAAVTTEFRAFVAIMALSTALALLGLIAIYARQIQVMGKFGAVAFVLALVGTMMIFGHQWASTFIVPVLAEETPGFLNAVTADTTTILAGGVFLSIFLMAVGWFLFGLASLKARILPTISIWLVLVGAFLMLVLDLVQFDLDKLVFNLGLGWMGWWLWSEQKRKF
jgi:hypothetical protein